jgi:hypothetical protein
MTPWSAAAADETLGTHASNSNRQGQPSAAAATEELL